MYQRKLEKGASVVLAGVFYKDAGETSMIQCQKCDHH